MYVLMEKLSLLPLFFLEHCLVYLFIQLQDGRFSLAECFNKSRYVLKMDTYFFDSFERKIHLQAELYLG